MKTRVMSIVNQTSKKEYAVYAAVILLLIVCYVMGDLRLQSGYRALEKMRHDVSVSADSLRSEILRADLQVNMLSSLERIAPMAENLGLALNEPANKVMFKVSSEGGQK